jgi:predicted transcriptional regulator
MSTPTRAGERQLAILRVLWRSAEATVNQVHVALARERPQATTTPGTIGTMLQKMEAKGLVRHRRDGRRYIYSAAVREEELRRSMVSDLVRQLFAGDAAGLVGHLVREA